MVPASHLDCSCSIVRAYKFRIVVCGMFCSIGESGGLVRTESTPHCVARTTPHVELGCQHSAPSYPPYAGQDLT